VYVANGTSKITVSELGSLTVILEVVMVMIIFNLMVFFSVKVCF
jgi:hypothetical protein